MTSELQYHQNSVAFPSLRLSLHWHTDEINVESEGNGEIRFTFMDLSPKRQGVELSVFGDSIELLRDPRIQWVLLAWQIHKPSPDSITPEALIELLEAMGIKPSEYQLKGLRK